MMKVGGFRSENYGPDEEVAGNGRGPNGGSWRHGSERQSSGKKSHLLSLASVKPQATDWLWQDRIPRGALTISTGLPGIGKSQQICDRIARITTGRNWPDGSPCPQGAAILLTAEDALANTVVPRLLAAGADLNRAFTLPLIRVDEKTERAFLLNEDLDQLERHLTEQPDINYIAVDPVTAYIGVGKVDSHKATDIRGVLGPLAALAERYNVAIEAVTHPPKSTTSAINAFIGSQAFIAAARVGYLTLAETDKDGNGTGRFLLTMVKTNVGPQMPTLAYRLAQVCVGEDHRDGRTIMASHVVWDEEPVDITAQAAWSTATGSGRPPKATAMDDAIRFLLTMLADGPRKVREIEEEARAAGLLQPTELISKDKPFRDARKALGVVTEKLGMAGGWVWHLPKAPPEAEGAFENERAPSDVEGTFAEDEPYYNSANPADPVTGEAQPAPAKEAAAPDTEPQAVPEQDPTGKSPEQPTLPQACAHCGSALGILDIYQTVADDRVTGMVLLHPGCKEPWSTALWARARARQSGAGNVRPGGEVKI